MHLQGLVTPLVRGLLNLYLCVWRYGIQVIDAPALCRNLELQVLFHQHFITASRDDSYFSYILDEDDRKNLGVHFDALVTQVKELNQYIARLGPKVTGI